MERATWDTFYFSQMLQNFLSFLRFFFVFFIEGIELLPFITTFLCCLLINMEYGILIGAQTHLLLLAYEGSRSKSTLTRYKVITDKIFMAQFFIKEKQNKFNNNYCNRRTTKSALFCKRIVISISRQWSGSATHWQKCRSTSKPRTELLFWIWVESTKSITLRSRWDIK